MLMTVSWPADLYGNKQAFSLIFSLLLKGAVESASVLGDASAATCKLMLSYLPCVQELGLNSFQTWQGVWLKHITYASTNTTCFFLAKCMP